MKRELRVTADGSTTLHLPDWGESYHSKNGAIAEAYHVFIKNGFEITSGDVRILEIGFGTGLNALITLMESSKAHRQVSYVAVEGYPLAIEEAFQMNYGLSLGVDESIFKLLHTIPWERAERISPHFSLEKRHLLFENISYNAEMHLIYFDAFGYRVQPELWSESIFRKMYNALLPGGILVTYACRSVIRKNMQAAGFKVEKLVGPPGKREMLRAVK